MTKFKPKPYDLTQPAEVIRLLRECRGYLHTCRRDHHGTDFQGRQFAMEAIDKICNGEVAVSVADRGQPEIDDGSYTDDPRLAKPIATDRGQP